MDEFQTPLIFKTKQDMLGYHGLGVKEMIFEEDFLTKESGGIAFPYHDDFDFISEDYPGLIDVTSKMGVPMYLSMPHFYSNDGSTYQKYGSYFIGLEPEGSLHKSRILVEYGRASQATERELAAMMSEQATWSAAESTCGERPSGSLAAMMSERPSESYLADSCCASDRARAI
jgi:hypothetical protein